MDNRSVGSDHDWDCERPRPIGLVIRQAIEAPQLNSLRSLPSRAWASEEFRLWLRECGFQDRFLPVPPGAAVTISIVADTIITGARLSFLRGRKAYQLSWRGCGLESPPLDISSLRPAQPRSPEGLRLGRQG